MKQPSRFRRVMLGVARGTWLVLLVLWGVFALALVAGWVQSTRAGFIERREASARTLVDQTRSLFYVDSVQGRIGAGIERSWTRNGYAGALSRLLGGAYRSVQWRLLNVPMSAGAHAVIGMFPPPASAPPAAPPQSWSKFLPQPPPASWPHRVGFVWHYESDATPAQAWSYSVHVCAPYWAVAPVVALPYPWVLRRRWRRRVARRRLASGCCVRCGYDVRVSTSGRCPECGATLAGPPPEPAAPALL